MAESWSEKELLVLMEAYSRLLTAELSGTPLTKSHQNKWVREQTGRSRGSVEYKFCNLSAALTVLGYPIIKGYKPMPNIQLALVDAAESYFAGLGLPREPAERRPTLASLKREAVSS